MTRVEDEKLVQFCATQYRHFVADEWQASDERWRAQLATAAYFLGTTYGYGHEKELLSVAEQLHPGLSGDFEAFRSLCELTGFEPSRFHDMLQAELGNTGGNFRRVSQHCGQMPNSAPARARGDSLVCVSNIETCSPR